MLKCLASDRKGRLLEARILDCRFEPWLLDDRPLEVAAGDTREYFLL